MLAYLRRMVSYIRQIGPAGAFGRFAAILCGIALTWASAAVGLMIVSINFNHCHGYGGGKLLPAKQRVRKIENAIFMYQIEHDRCPPTRDALVANGNLVANDLLDPWGRSIAYWCTEDDAEVTSAGADGEFGTFDDIKDSD